jgi:hypothetical protein
VIGRSYVSPRSIVPLSYGMSCAIHFNSVVLPHPVNISIRSLACLDVLFVVEGEGGQGDRQ